MENKKSRNQTLDLLKFVSAFAVVCIHYMFYGSAGEIARALSRFAVPFFFAISGYFAYNNNSKKILQKAKHIFFVYAGSFLLYFFYSAFKYILSSRPISEYFLSYLDTSTILDFFILNVTVSSAHLWFLPALIYCYLLYFAIKKKCPENVMIIVSFIFMGFYLFAEEVFPIFEIHIPKYIYANVFFRAFPCFVLGFAAKKYQLFIKEKISTKTSFGILILGIIETVLSVVLFGNSITYFGSILMTSSLLFLAIQYEHKTYNNTLVKLSKQSTFIYVFHVAVGGVIQTILDYIGIGDKMLWINAKPLVVFALTVLLSIIIECLLEYVQRRNLSRY